MCANLKQVLSWEIKKIDLLKLWIYNLWFVCYRKSWHLCMRCWACLRTPWFSMMSWMLCSHSTSSSLLQEVCITFVLHITHQVIPGVTYCKPTFILCKKFLRSWQEPHCREYFSPQTSIWQIHVLVCGEIYSLFFFQKLFPNSIAQWIRALNYYKYGSYEFESSGGFY